MTVTRHVLVPIDFSAISLEAVRAARELAVKSSQFTLLHVYDYWEEMGPVTLDLVSPRGEFVNDKKKKLLDGLRGIRKRQFNGVDKVDLEIIVDRSPAAAICRYAGAKGVDLIILTTHGRTGLSHLLMGSVAEEVVRQAPCPVLVIRPARRTASRKSA